MRKKEKKKEIDFNNLKNATISGASSEVVQRYGSAVKEHYMSYTGINNETGKQVQKLIQIMNIIIYISKQVFLLKLKSERKKMLIIL